MSNYWSVFTPSFNAFGERAFFSNGKALLVPIPDVVKQLWTDDSPFWVRQSTAFNLALNGVVIDPRIDIWQWDILHTYRYLSKEGYTWVPSMITPPMLATKLMKPGLKPFGDMIWYDPQVPLEASILVPPLSVLPK